MESDLGKLFIGGISWDTDEERLKEYFRKYGEVVEAVIIRDRVTGRARGFGFIVFADPSVAERVKLEKHVIDGRTVEAKRAVPKDDQHFLSRNTGIIPGSPSLGRTKKIFVGGLPSTVTEGDFKKYFDQFGTITDVVVMYDHNTQRPRGFGFITFDSEEGVDRVLYKTFHELNGKMVEVKRAVPKDLSPGPTRSPLVGYNYGLNRATGGLNTYAQGYSMSPLGGYGVGRFSPITSDRSGFSPFGTGNYGIGVNLEPGPSPSYGRNSNFGNSLGYAQMLTPYYKGNSNRYTTPIGYNGGNRRGDSLLSSETRNVWGNAGLNTGMNFSGPGAYYGSGSESFEVAVGNSGANWSSSSPISNQGGGNVSGYNSGGIGYGSGNSNLVLGGMYGRKSGSGAAATSSVAATPGSFEGSYGDSYHSGSVYSDSAWRSTNPELNRSGSFGYGLGDIEADVAEKSSDGYTGSYNSSRNSNRGIAA